MLKLLSSVGDDMSKNKPAVNQAYRLVKEAAQRLQ